MDASIAAATDEDQDAYSNLIFAVMGFALFYWLWNGKRKRYPDLKDIPAYGHRRTLPSYLDALRYMIDCRPTLRSAYKNLYPRIFRISTLHRWKVLLSGPHHLEELRKAPDDIVSLSAAANDPDSAHYLFGHCRGAMTTKVVLEWTRCLTQNLPYMLPGIREEILLSLKDSLANPTPLNIGKEETPSQTEWHRVRAACVIENTVSRVVNRAFLGTRISRDESYSQLSAACLKDVYSFSITRYIGNYLPSSLCRLASAFTPSSFRLRRMRTKLKDLIVDARRGKQTPNSQQQEDLAISQQFDLLTFLLEQESAELSVQDLANMLAEASLKSMQMISPISLQTLRHLIASPDDTASMRHELHNAISKYGWNNPHTLDRLHQLDSFIKETMRVEGVSAVSTMRKTVAGFTFQDGTYLPPGTLLNSNAYARHHDASIYPAPSTFNGLRFSSMYDEHRGLYGDDSGGVRFGLTTASPSFLAWGHGRHACPGRYFASVVMKMILAEIMILWDMRFEDGSSLPNDNWIGDVCLPNRSVEILVRARCALARADIGQDIGSQRRPNFNFVL